MAEPLLDRFEFTEEDWDEVQSFDCGEGEAAQEVSDWLKQPADRDGALAALKQTPPAGVWIYRLADESSDRIVGFGALAKARSGWRWPGHRNNDPPLPVTLILWFAVDRVFQGQPATLERKDRYAGLILRSLINEAMKDAATHPVLGLCVREGNEKAISLYEEAGFFRMPKGFKDGGVDYLRMAKILDAVAVQAFEVEAKKRTKR